MTDHTTAAQAAMQESERVTAADEYFAARTWIMDTNDNRRIFEAGFDRAYALLSKLRAPVADERAAFEAWMASQNLGVERDGDSYSLTYARRAWEAWQARAALASAPVAGEAQDAARWRAYATQFPQVSSVFLQVHGDPAPQATQVERQDRAGDFIKLAEAIVKAHESMFAQCCSNPVRNAWGVEVNMLPLNQAYELARAALSAQPGAQKKREAPYA